MEGKSIHFQYLLPPALMVLWEPIATVNIEWPIPLTCTYLDCMRKSQDLNRTHTKSSLDKVLLSDSGLSCRDVTPLGSALPLCPDPGSGATN